MMCDYHFFRNICPHACAAVNKATAFESIEHRDDEKARRHARILGAKSASLIGGRLGVPGLGK